MNPDYGKDLDIVESCSWTWNEESKRYTLDEESYFAKEWVGEEIYSDSRIQFVVHVLSGEDLFSEKFYFYFYSEAKQFMDERLAAGECAVIKKV